MKITTPNHAFEVNDTLRLHPYFQCSKILSCENVSVHQTPPLLTPPLLIVIVSGLYYTVDKLSPECQFYLQNTCMGPDNVSLLSFHHRTSITVKPCRQQTKLLYVKIVI